MNDTATEMEEIKAKVAALAPLSIRKLEDARRLALHFQDLLQHPVTLCTPRLHEYLASLDAQNSRSFSQKREYVEVKYIYASETKNNQQRQRFNSLPISEVSELLKAEFANVEKSQQVHICTECDVEIDTNDEEHLMESLQRHFNLDVHQPKKRHYSVDANMLKNSETVDVSEPIVLPNLSRRKSAMVERGEAIAPPATLEHLEQIMKESLNVKTEKPDRLFSAKLETFLIRNLPDNSEASINVAVKLYQSIYEQLCREVAAVDFSPLTSAVAPIIMSIKDNVNQNFTAEPGKSFDADDNDQSQDKPPKNQMKKFRYYGPIESAICKLLSAHKLLSLVDDRTGKPAFFCVACEYYTLRFRYDSVLNHVFGETHVHNLSSILEADDSVSFHTKERSVDKIREINEKFLSAHSIVESNEGVSCGLCRVTVDSADGRLIHALDENHLGRLSDKIFRKVRSVNPDAPIPDEWGNKSADWAKYLSSTAKVSTSRDTVAVENFIKSSGKVANYCSSCDMTLKGPRQVLFNHVRQKKHLRYVAPQKLQLLYRNHCRPVEYYASFGNFYTCAICCNYTALPSFSSVVEHVESDAHMEAVSLYLKFGLHPAETPKWLTENGIIYSSEAPYKCEICDETLPNARELVTHVLSSVRHQNCIVEKRQRANRGDVISAYMKGNYILCLEGAKFACAVCKGSFNSVRSLLMHLVYAEHFDSRPSSEGVFRFYLELKHNVNLLVRNKYSYSEFGRLYCGACEAYAEEGENAKRHVVSARHRESMGVAYTVVNDGATQE